MLLQELEVALLGSHVSEWPPYLPQDPGVMIFGRGTVLLVVGNDGLRRVLDEIWEAPARAVNRCGSRTWEPPVDDILANDDEDRAL